jgi:hypothetical protein
MKKKIQDTRYKVQRVLDTRFTIHDSRGQVIIILLLVMLLALSIGLAITQRSTNDLATSSQTEQSTRAFSAAEAGLEKAVQQGTTVSTQAVPLGNQTSAEIVNSGFVPVPGSGIALEYPPIGKETIAQVWLSDPANPQYNYSRSSFNLYFGNSPIGGFNTTSNIHPAVEVNIVTCTATSGVCSQYQNQRYYYDSIVRNPANNFSNPSSVPQRVLCNNPSINTILANNSQFACGVLVDISNCVVPSCIPQVVRIRLLYANTSQKIAVAPIAGAALPPQVELYTSKGKAGQTEKALQLFRVKEMVPSWIDFAIFSVNNITK